ncbi:MAG: putative tRNA threonylcarbamoyladenosine biosynthesis protein Gcp [Parcubacteria group bacterium GW2011_GWB1_45_7]|nr:MAG: putative tRNA threonylcarbamoyladenosine biosynthesis protein Gcp [Parcubacteria group bacterium GW2011_GWB1_45_7]OGY57735.1 MAG: tRNA (adenosine(37)-N6)-threonylcarbamoyltransferase complex transferase subunit TsaD [Candidatus Colwellbacteria bacterium RIFCSPHIGHO2_02_FULL_45_17]
MRILAIETSCDETAAALVEASDGLKNPKFRVLKNIVSSQIETHRPYGGVVPLLAKREHIRNLPIVLKQVQGKSKNEKVKIDDVDIVAVTVGPGLEPALLVGIEFAKHLAKKLKKKLVGANHLEGHLYSFLLTQESKKEKGERRKLEFPAIGLIVSGGHTILLLMNKLESWKKIGETRDDAVGEAFDKVARMLGLPYPGGPEIERLAKTGNPHAIEFPRPMIHHKNFDFSFAGLKTAVYYETRNKKFTRKQKADLAASFQEAAVDVLARKTMRAVEAFGAKSVILAGGVAANKALRTRIGKECKKLGKSFFVSDFKYSGDNASMIAAATYINLLKKKAYHVKMQANLNL